MLNIYINDGNLTIPKDETCYIIAKGGVYLKKKLDLVESLTPVDKISFLEEIPTYAALDIPKIPVRMIGGIVGFFTKVYEMYKSEAIVLLFYDKVKKTYKVYVPEQEVSMAHCNYKIEKTIKDHMLIGSIHSHGSMSAFHSGVDVGDEEKFDGIHITIGKVDEEFFDIVSSIAINGLRVPVVATDYIEGLEVREYTKYFPNMFRPAFQEIDGVKYYTKDVKPTTGFTLTCGNESPANIFWFNKEWLRHVKEKKYEYVNAWSGLTSAARYRIVNGKLVEIKESKKDKKKNKNKHHQGSDSYNFYESDYYKNLMKTPTKEEEEIYRAGCESYCNDCTHRHEKIKIEEVNKTPDNACLDNYEFDFADYNKWGW
jgi:hypothetical protein